MLIVFKKISTTARLLLSNSARGFIDIMQKTNISMDLTINKRMMVPRGVSVLLQAMRTCVFQIQMENFMEIKLTVHPTCIIWSSVSGILGCHFQVFVLVANMWFSSYGKEIPQKLLCLIIACPLDMWDEKIKNVSS